MSRVHVLGELAWNFTDHANPPSVMPKVDVGRSGYTQRISVDPFPAYSHDPELVASTLERVRVAFPMPDPFSPWIFLLEHEVLSRTNGQAGIEHDYEWEPPEDDPRDEGNQRPWRGYIVLSGKRIPPHPGMTRYLVAHEYGHVVEDWLIRGRRERVYSQDLLLEYADRRGLAPSAFTVSASGGAWHRAIQEIFANDFRLLVTKIEPGYWPHAGIDRPEGIAAIRRWWSAERRKAVRYNVERSEAAA